MTQLTILTASEQRTFDRPPVLNSNERRIYFSITPEIRSTLNRIKTPANKVGFLLQLGYFRANARFYQATLFHQRDVKYIKKLLKIDGIFERIVDRLRCQRFNRLIQSLAKVRNRDTNDVRIFTHAAPSGTGLRRCAIRKRDATKARSAKHALPAGLRPVT